MLASEFHSTATDPAPYPGPMRQGADGPAVVAMQGGLHVWSAYRAKSHPLEEGLRHDLPTGHWLAPTTRQVAHFQTIHDIPVSGMFGPHVHTALGKWYTPVDRAILRELAYHRKIDDARTMLAQIMDTTGGRRDDWTYTQGVLRMQLEIPQPWHDPSTARYVHADCSSSTGCILKWVLRYYGFDAQEAALGGWPTTYTTIDVGHAVSIGDLKLGDRVHYGANSHMTLYRGERPGQGSTKWVWSFGGEPGPRWVPLDYRPIYACRRDLP